MFYRTQHNSVKKTEKRYFGRWEIVVIDKADGVVDLVSNNFINRPDCMIMYLRDLYACCLQHGFMPETMLLSTIIPIPKDPNGTGQKFDSYRGIALSSLCTKVFEYVILNMHGDCLISNNLQFAYKAGTSTTQCTWAAREVISYYNNKGIDVYCCLLDCSKAFDLIKYDKLLEKLVAKDVPPVTIRVLMVMYINGKVRVKWNKEVSEYFNVSNGVRQGSVLSSYLFSIYIYILMSL